MKFEFHKIAIIAALVLFVGAAAVAQGKQAQAKAQAQQAPAGAQQTQVPAGSRGYTGPGGSQAVTVSQVSGLADNTYVSLEGFVTQSLRENKFTFKDDSGSIIVDVNDDVLEVTPAFNEQTKVRIYGSVDQKWQGFEIDVERLELLQ